MKTSRPTHPNCKTGTDIAARNFYLVPVANFLLAASLLVFLLPSLGFAATSTFTGAGGNGDWSTAGNWSSIPSAGDDIVIADTTAQANLVIDAAQSIGQLTLGDLGTRTNAFAISGPENLTLTNGLVASGNFSAVGLTITAPVIIGSAQTWTIGGTAGNANTNAGVQVNNATAGTQRTFTLGGTLTKDGAGQLGFTGLNIGNGNIQITAGSLKLNAANSTRLTVGGTGTITVGSGASLIFSQTGANNLSTFTVGKAISLQDGARLQVGGSTSFNTNQSTITSTITLAANSHVILDAQKTGGGADTSFVFGSTWAGGVNATLEKTGTATVKFTNSAVNAQFSTSLKISEGTLILAATASDGGWRGPIDIASGAQLMLAADNQVANGVVLTVNGLLDAGNVRDIVGGLLGGGTITNAGRSLTQGFFINGYGTTFSGALWGNSVGTTSAASNTQTFTGTVSVTNLSVNAANSVGGIKFSENAIANVTNIVGSVGTLTIEDNAKLTVGSGGIGISNNVVLGGGIGVATLAAGTDNTIAGQMELVDGSGGRPVIDSATNTMTMSAEVSGSGGFTKIGTGKLILEGDNTYAGGSVISAGTVEVAHVNGLGSGAATISGAGSLDLGSLAVTNNILYAGGSVTDAGQYAGTLNVISNSTFSASGTFGGRVVVESGSRLNGTGTISGLATIEDGGTLAPGNSPGTITFSDGLTLVGGSILDFYLGTDGNSLVSLTGGTLSISGVDPITLNITESGVFGAGTYTLFQVIGGGSNAISNPGSSFAMGSEPGGFNYSFVLNGSNIDLQVTAIPEPMTARLVLCCAILAAALRIRRRK